VVDVQGNIKGANHLAEEIGDGILDGLDFQFLSSWTICLLATFQKFQQEIGLFGESLLFITGVLFESSG
jgi:hypothetical protein